MNKMFSDTASSVPLGSSVARFSDGKDTKSCQACLSTKAINSKINIVSDCNINEIHLNIFPPSATYVKEQPNSSSSQLDDSSHSYLNIDVHKNLNQKPINGTEHYEGKRKVSLGNFSHISVKRCDSLLHISIGNSSKITKRHKKHSWLIAKLWKFSRKSERKCFFSPQLDKDGIYKLSNRSINIGNDELTISIHKRSYGEPCTSTDYLSHNDVCHKQLRLIESDLSQSFLDSSDEIEHGANELDCYMNEIKRREMR